MSCLVSALAKEATLRKQGDLVETDGLQTLRINCARWVRGSRAGKGAGKRRERLLSGEELWPALSEGLTLQTCGE